MKIGKRMINVGICFSRPFEGNSPLVHIGDKLPVYLRLLELSRQEGWGVYVLTRKTYQGDGVFDGAWEFIDGKFNRLEKPVKIDLVYDRTGGVVFPPKDDLSTKWVNNRDFKLLAWDKLASFNEIGEDMPATYWVGDLVNYDNVVDKIKGDWVVLKPYNGLKGMGIFIGPKEKALGFKPQTAYKKYIAQEFVDTSMGIPGLTPGLHDLRVVIINRRPVWCHIRTPRKGSFKANVAEGGSLTEIDYETVPDTLKSVVKKMAEKFYLKFDNPVFSLDFGMDQNGKPYIFEINDQIGFPRPKMKNRDTFLNALIENFRSKLL